MVTTSKAALAGTDTEATLLELLLLFPGTLPSGEVSPRDDTLLLLLLGTLMGGDMNPRALGTPPAAGGATRLLLPSTVGLLSQVFEEEDGPEPVRWLPTWRNSARALDED